MSETIREKIAICIRAYLDEICDKMCDLFSSEIAAAAEKMRAEVESKREEWHQFATQARDGERPGSESYYNAVALGIGIASEVLKNTITPPDPQVAAKFKAGDDVIANERAEPFTVRGEEGKILKRQDGETEWWTVDFGPVIGIFGMRPDELLRYVPSAQPTPPAPAEAGKAEAIGKTYRGFKAKDRVSFNRKNLRYIGTIKGFGTPHTAQIEDDAGNIHFMHLDDLRHLLAPTPPKVEEAGLDAKQPTPAEICQRLGLKPPEYEACIHNARSDDKIWLFDYYRKCWGPANFYASDDVAFALVDYAIANGMPWFDISYLPNWKPGNWRAMHSHSMTEPVYSDTRRAAIVAVVLAWAEAREK